MSRPWLKFVAPLLALLMPALGVLPDAAFSERAPVRQAALAQDEDPGNARVIVKYRAGASLLRSAPRRPQHAAALGRQFALSLSDGRVLGERTQGLRGRGLSSAALAARLAAHPEVEWAVVDQRRTISAVLPNDPYFADGQVAITPVVGQWYLRSPDSTIVSAANALGAWATTTGSPAITVAVLDTGVRFDHPDLAGKLYPGYDFVSRDDTAQDGQPGRDSDANDPGDWSSAGDSCGAHDSSWHGSQTAGLIGAATDNGIGMAGMGRDVMLLPVRVLGKCGGFDSDIIAAMRWAAGLSTDPQPNPHPAQVINMSLGSTGACAASYRDVMLEVTGQGVVVVVAAGNDVGHAVNSPANCPGAIAVAGVRHAGTKVGYSNIGPEVAIAAPAGNCVNLSGACLYPLLTTLDTGKTVPVAPGYSDGLYEGSGGNPSLGTSFSAPLVAGTVALMLSVDPTLTPAKIKAALQASSRPFPTSGSTDASVVACHAPNGTDQSECYCSTGTCGAGLLDAGAAVARVDGLVVTLSKPSSVNPGATLTADGLASTVHPGRSIASYQWTLVDDGAGAHIVGAATKPSVDVVADRAGKYTLSLVVTDNTGIASRANAVIGVAESPTARIAPATSSPTVGAALSYDGTGSSADTATGRTVAGYQWSLAAANTANASFVGVTTSPLATVTASAVGTFVLSLTVTDSGGLTATTLTAVTVAAAPPPPESSGGGAIDGGWLAGLALATLALAWRGRVTRRSARRGR